MSHNKSPALSPPICLCTTPIYYHHAYNSTLWICIRAHATPPYYHDANRDRAELATCIPATEHVQDGNI